MNMRQLKDRQANEDNLDTIIRDMKKKHDDGRTQMLLIKKV